MRGTIILGYIAVLTDGYAAGIKDATQLAPKAPMYHAARPQIAATPAARKSGRLAARVARDDRGEAKLGSASGWDLPPERPALDPLDLPDVGDDSALIADPAEARAIFGGGLLDLRPDSAATVAALPQQAIASRLRAVAWRRRMLAVATTLRIVDAAALPELLPQHQRQAHIHAILARLTRTRLAALALARMRVVHAAITARILRAGRVAVLTSTAPPVCC